MTLTNRWRKGSLRSRRRWQTSDGIFASRAISCGQRLVEKIPAQPLRDFFTDGAGTRAKLSVNEKKLFHIVVGH